MSFGRWLHQHWWLAPVALAAQAIPGVLPAEGALFGVGGSGAAAAGGLGAAQAGAAAGIGAGAPALAGDIPGLAAGASAGGGAAAGWGAMHPALAAALHAAMHYGQPYGMNAFSNLLQHPQTMPQGGQMPSYGGRSPEEQRLMDELSAYWAQGAHPGGMSDMGGYGGGMGAMGPYGGYS